VSIRRVARDIESETLLACNSSQTLANPRNNSARLSTSAKQNPSMKACSLSRVVLRNRFISRPIPLSERLSLNRVSPFWVFETGGRLPHPRTSGVSCPGVFRAHQPTETSMNISRYFDAFVSPFRLRRRVGLRSESGRCDGRNGRGGPLLLSLS
jgi:hypothetical protein